MEQEADKCPKCGYKGLDSKWNDAADDLVYYIYECPGCGFSGQQVFEPVFKEHLDEDGEEVSK